MILLMKSGRELEVECPPERVAAIHGVVEAIHAVDRPVQEFIVKSSRGVANIDLREVEGYLI